MLLFFIIMFNYTELEHHKTKPYYSYKLVQVMDGKKAYINPNWSYRKR